MSVQRVAGSFRDPSGFVFMRNQEVFRSVDDQCYEILFDLAQSGRFDELVDRNLIVGTLLGCQQSR